MLGTTLLTRKKDGGLTVQIIHINFYLFFLIVGLLYTPKILKEGVHLRRILKLRNLAFIEVE